MNKSIIVKVIGTTAVGFVIGNVIQGVRIAKLKKEIKKIEKETEMLEFANKVLSQFL